MPETGVTMTIEPEGRGYGRHMLTVDRDGPEWEDVTGFLILTAGELEQLACLIQNHREGKAMGAEKVIIHFTDTTGRPPPIRQEGI